MGSKNFNLIAWVGFAAFAAMSAPGCDDAQSDATNDGGSGATGGQGAGATGGQGTGASSEGGGAECGPGAELCDGACTVTQLDHDNCGECGNACDSEQEVCTGGECVSACGGGLSRCGGVCVDTDNDLDHCGDCDNPCLGATDACIDGECVAQTPPAAVYTMTNDVAGNRILSFSRADDGSLSSSGSFTATGGLGTGAGLGNQHGLVFDEPQGRFFAVNAGDDSISMLALHLDGSLELLSHVPSGGVRPIAITVFGDAVYVVNAGNPATSAAANISGFTIAGDSLTPVAGSTQPLSAANPNPAQIQFSPDGSTLVVTEKGTNAIVTYDVTDGVAAGPVVTPSSGQTPFGFDFTASQQVIVSEAAGGQAGLSSTSSYSIAQDGGLVTVSGSVPTTRSAACWLVVAGDHAYVANAASNDITGFQIAADGSLTLLNADGIAGQTAAGATDEDVSDDGEYLYVVTNAAHVLSIFHINADGSLDKKPDFVGLPSGVSGLVAR